MTPSIDYGTSLIFAFTLFFVGAVYAKYFSLRGYRGALLIFSIGFLVRILAVYGIYHYLIAAGGDGFVIGDDRQYDVVAKEIAGDIRAGLSGYKELNTGWVNVGYFNLGGWLYYHFGFDTVSARIFNAFLSSITSLFVYAIAQKSFGPKEGKISAWIYALLPSVIFWSTQHLKDSLVIYLTVIVMYSLIVKMGGIRGTLVALIQVVIAIFCLWFVRKDLCFPLAAMVAAALAIKLTPLGLVLDKKKIPLVLQGLGMGILLAAVLLITNMTKQGEEFQESLSGVGHYQEKLVRTGNAGFTNRLRVVSAGDIYKLPAAMLFTMAAPLPNFSAPADPRTLGLSLYAYLNIPLIILTPCILLGFYIMGKYKMSIIDSALIRWFPVAVLAGISIFYLGVLRYNSQLLFGFSIFAGVALANRRRFRVLLQLGYIGYGAALLAGLLLAIYL
jgi:4-amino-4-deoxy-L-arabinose transferase-like glycosyltransferase